MKTLALLLAVSVASPAFANNYFIPNHQRSFREKNTYTAVPWSNRREVGLDMEVGNGTRNPEASGEIDIKNDTITPHLYFKAENGFAVDAEFKKENEKLKRGTASGKDNEENFELHTGYEMGDFAFSLGFVNSREDQGTSTSETQTNTILLGFGTRLGGDFYLGFGYSRVNDRDDDKNNHFDVGVGKVFGAADNPDGSIEGNLLFAPGDDGDSLGARAYLLVREDALQYFGTLIYTKVDGKTSDIAGYGVQAGLDYQFETFFAGAKFEYVKVTQAGSDDSATGLHPVVQAGYRKDKLEAYVQLGQNRLDSQTSTPGSEDFEQRVTEIAFGGNLSF